MKLLLVVVVITFSCVIAEYTSRYDEVKLDEVLSNKRLLNGYMKCALDKGPCTPEGKELKFYIVDALKSGCEKCTDRHRKSIKKVIKHLVKNEPEYWQQAVDKYDPDKKYTHTYEKELKNW
ncbi:unnamed protein product [Arctia plantaginis]|uniref:Uncharacterized protein n=1 Tax=Arctia plantaginis TaxID=874455 RepID=A0A8S0Z808_ARCPL|nr:unnamed protein product [Arctia plantaginis]